MIVNTSHYKKDKTIEPIDVIEDWGLDFCLGNVIKYIARAPYKGNTREDLEKALWYLQRHINTHFAKETINNGKIY